MQNILLHFTDNIINKCKLPEGAHLIAGVSGGMDSMVMLRLILEVRQELKLKIAVAHFNHKLRGQDADQDENFVKTYCEKQGIEFVSGSADVKDFSAKNGISIEMAAREQRHAFLTKTAENLCCRHIALAHHADDQIELYLLRILRGSGPTGLKSMSWINPSPFNKEIYLIRPLLDLTKSDIQKIASALNIEYRQDRSNFETDIPRNKIRHALIPYLRNLFNKNIDRVFLKNIELQSAIADYIEKQALEYIDQGFSSPDFSLLHPAIQRECIRIQLIQKAIVPHFKMIEFLRLNPNKPYILSNQKQVYLTEKGTVKEQTLITLNNRFPNRVSAISEIKLTGQEGIINFGKKQIHWKIIPKSPDFTIQQKHGQEHFDADAVGDTIKLRNWERGDRFQPIGFNANAKLQDIFVNHKIAISKRHELIIAATANNEIFWVEGLRIGEKFKVQHFTKRLLHWSWTSNEPSI